MRLARDITGLAAALNETPPLGAQSRFITARTVMSECSDGVTILRALTAASADPAVGWALQFLGQDSGLDIGDPFTQGMVDQLVAAEVLNTAQGEQIKALAHRLQFVTQEEVAAEMYNPDGTEK